MPQDTAPENEDTESVVINKKEKPIPEDTEAEFKLKKDSEDDTVPVEFTIKKKVPERSPSVEEHTDEITIKKLKKVKPRKESIPEFTEVETVTFRPKSTKTKEDVEQEFTISLDEYAEEEISLTSKVKLKKTETFDIFRRNW